MKDPITTTEAAAIIGIDPSQVRRYCQRGALTAQRMGRDWMIERQAAQDFKPAPVGPPRKERKSKKKPAAPID
jgi:excisionase family DNA binding protein